MWTLMLSVFSLIQGKLVSSLMLPRLRGWSSFSRFTCLWFPFSKMGAFTNTADISNLYFTVRNTSMYFIISCGISHNVNGKGKMFQKSRNVQLYVIQHADRNVTHQYLLDKQISLHEEWYKNIIITNILVSVEYFYVSHIRELPLIQPPRGILAAKLDELSYSCSVTFITWQNFPPWTL